jgi:TonB-dependent SusC/RagA subfamily outer membrane receptor
MSTAAWAQTVSGTVTDENNQPLPGATVIVQGTTTGTSTDFDGKYQINATQGQTLVFSYVGYATQNVVVNSATHDVSLQLDNTLDEVVVAYGTQSKKSLTGSVGIVSSEAIEIVRNPNVVQGVTGKVAGVQVINDSGQPGEEPTVRIRGLGSLYSEAGPLYFVDGVPFNRDVSSISNNDIASMTILKDAAAGALYGHRGANGVVIITTKKGRKGGINNAPAGNYSITVTHKGDLQGVDGNPFQQFDQAFSVILSGGNLTLSSSSLVRDW